MAARISIGLGIAGGLLATRLLIGFASSLNPTFGRVPQAARDLIHCFSASSMRVCQLLPVDLKQISFDWVLKKPLRSKANFETY